jgi:hypothetical protein
VKTDGEAEEGADGAAASTSAASDGGRTYADYSYESLIQRVADIIHAKNPELTEKKRTTMKPPMLMRVGTKKTLWANFQDICKSMRRNPEHVFQVKLYVELNSLFPSIVRFAQSFIYFLSKTLSLSLCVFLLLLLKKTVLHG